MQTAFKESQDSVVNFKEQTEDDVRSTDPTTILEEEKDTFYDQRRESVSYRTLVIRWLASDSSLTLVETWPA